MNFKVLLLLWAFIGSSGVFANCSLYSSARSSSDISVAEESLFRSMPYESEQRQRWVFENYADEMRSVLERGEFTVSALKQVVFTLAKSRKTGDAYLFGFVFKRTQNEETQEVNTSVSLVLAISDRSEFSRSEAQFNRLGFDQNRRPSRFSTIEELNFERMGSLFDLETRSEFDFGREEAGQKVVLRFNLKKNRYSVDMENFTLIPASEFDPDLLHR